MQRTNWTNMHSSYTATKCFLLGILNTTQNGISFIISRKKHSLHIEYVAIDKKKKKKINQWIYKGEQHKMIILSACSNSKIFMFKSMPAQKLTIIE